MLKEESIKFETEYFLWPPFLRNLWVCFLSVNFLMFIAVLSSILVGGFEFFKLIFMLIVIYFIKNIIDFIDYKSNLGRVRSFKKQFCSQNILTKVKAKTNFMEGPVAIFSAHYDSACFNYPERFLKYMFLIYVSYFSIYFPISYIIDLHFIAKLLSCITFLVFLGFFLSIRINNKSNGSIDNASGTAILIELAKIFHTNPLNNIDLIFLWAGAEEFGLWGTKNYCARNFEWLDKNYNLNKSYNINIDMVGSYIGLIDKVGIFKKTILNKSLNNILEDIAREKEISLIKETKSISFLSDHIIFKFFAKKLKKELQVCWFNSKKDSKFIHSSTDTPEKCLSKNLNGCIEICHHALNKLDTDLDSNTMN
ncbi:MAG: M28 family metallopeptidase [Promethearchaeota archaeon]